ncbi:MAG: hypothetical protein AAFQ79_01310 [Pseudomonadota bacterium]
MRQPFRFDQVKHLVNGESHRKERSLIEGLVGRRPIIMDANYASARLSSPS